MTGLVVIGNAKLLCMDGDMRLIENGYVCVGGGKILEIGEGEVSAGHMNAGDYVDAGGMWLMPGFINTHTHLPMTLLRGYADDLPLHRWLSDHIFPAEALLIRPENIRPAVRLAVAEMVRSGTTCFNDMYYYADIIADEAAKLGMRGRLNESLIDYPTPSFRSVEKGLGLAEAFIQKWEGNDLIHPSVCVHAPYSSSKTTLLAAKRLADRYDVILHTHISETQKEVEEITVAKGMRPVEYLADMGLLDQHFIGAHAVWLNEKEQELLAKSGASIAHCPKSNLKLGSGIADIHTYTGAGINVSVATDGTASNNTLDMLEELRFAALLPKGIHWDAAAGDARSILKMATIQAAHALGLGDITGSLEVGKRADILLIDPTAPNMTPAYDPYSTLVYAAHSENIHSSMINGAWVMRDRKLLRIDVEETRREVTRIVDDFCSPGM